MLAVVSAPPRHGKTESELHALAWLLARKPSMQLAFVGYAAAFAEKKSAKARDLARKVGIPISDTSSSKQDWRTGVDDGGMWASSIGGSLTGEGFHFMAVDDPVKDRAAAESAAQREHTYEWFTDTAFTRLEPMGSCIVTQTRWHEADLGGRLIEEGWENVCLPAIDDERRALWPERFSLEQLDAIREQLGEYGWWSLYQGKPRPRGGALFKDATTFTDVPSSMRTVIGIDFAYTAKSRADYSVAVVLGQSGTHYYVLDVIRQQTVATEFAASLRVLKARYPHARMASYVGGTEKAVLDFLKDRESLVVDGMPAKADKFVRAQATAAAWAAGKISVRAAQPWTSQFLEEVCSFSGVGDAHDDQVDALVSGFDALQSPVLSKPSQMRANALMGTRPRL